MTQNNTELLAAVKKDGKWGWINKSGSLVLPHQWDEVRGFQKA